MPVRRSTPTRNTLVDLAMTAHWENCGDGVSGRFNYALYKWLVRITLNEDA
ncbi:MAG: hypothetical protein WBM00_08255 [Solirubrobacterales bacterium]